MTRYIRLQILLILLGGVLVGILLTYLTINYTTVLRPGSGGTYVEGLTGFPHQLNPLLSSYNEVDRDICALLFSGLTRFNSRGEVEPDLAREWEWEITPEGLQIYTVYLRSDIYWHDGTPITAEDVLFTISLLQDPDFSGPADLGAALWRTVTVEVVDRRTVRFTLPQPYAPFMDYTTMGILPAHVLAGVSVGELSNHEFNTNPVGSGPFQIEEVEMESGVINTMVLKKYARYHGDQPYLDRIQFRFYPSYQTALKAYETGEVEGVSQILTEDLTRARALPTLNLFSAHMAQYSLVLLNLQNQDVFFFQEPEVRQALLYGLDRQAIIDQQLGGQALIAHSPIVPGTWAYDEEIKHYAHDPGRAGELMDGIDWKRRGEDNVRFRNGKPLAFTLLTSSEPRKVEIAQAMAEQWEALGIPVTVETVSPLDIPTRLERHDFEAILIDLALPGDPDPYPFWHETQIEGGQNYAGFTNRRISEVTEQARVINSREKREALYDEFQELFAQEVPALLLHIPVYTYGVDERIHNVQIAPLMHPADRFRTISDWWIVPRRVFVSEEQANQP